MFREVEVQKALGARNRLEITNCMDFISKQLERNPFEDVAIVSDDGDFWTYIVEGEVKQHVRISKISEVFGFRVEGFPEMAVLGACLKFVNKKMDMQVTSLYSTSLIFVPFNFQKIVHLWV